MRPSGPTFWLLGGLPGWRTAATDGSSVSTRDGIRLAGEPNGPLSLAAPDGSLGGLLLPSGMALDDRDTLYLLAADLTVKRFDPDARAFRPLRDVGGQGTEPRRFNAPSNIAIASGRLFVADTGNRRVQQFDLDTLALTAIWKERYWTPADVASYKGSLYILDSKNARVYRREPHSDRLHTLLERNDRAKQWSRIALDTKGGIWLLNTSDPAKPVLEPVNPQDQPATDAGDVRDRFAPPPFRLDVQGRFCMPESLVRFCGRREPQPPPVLEVPLTLCAPFDRTAKRCASPTAPTADPIAVSSSLVYVIRRSRRAVEAFTEGGRKLRHTWGPWNASRTPVVNTASDAWDPVDVAARDNLAWVLDGRYQTVYRHQAGREILRPIFTAPASSAWARIAVTATNCLYLYSAGNPNVQVYTCAGEPVGEKPYNEVANAFARTTFSLPQDHGLIFDRQGDPVDSVDPAEDTTPPFYKTTGTWRSQPLDSKIYRCEWHRIELSVASLPPGSKVEIKTFSHENATDVLGIPLDHWQAGYTIVAPPQPDPCKPRADQPFDFLVQSGGGRFLSIVVTLSGNGYSTPAVDRMRVHYPRDSYLQYLPAAYSQDDEGRLFLSRFLSIFQTEWDDLDHQIDHIERLFDPDAVPAGPFLEFLARQWLALPLEADWTPEQKRRLLSAAPKIYPHRGQASGLRDYLRVYLANIAGLDQPAGEYPMILEGFEQRRHVMMLRTASARLGRDASLWSPSVVRRLQLGVFSQVGEVDLVSTGDPDRDIFYEYANRFSIFIPAVWIRTAKDERMIRRAIEAEKPAHAAYDLCLVESRFRLGVQCTIGLDTIIGDLPAMALDCGPGEDVPPSLPMRNRLGFDTVLGGLPESARHHSAGTTVGKDSLLA